MREKKERKITEEKPREKEGKIGKILYLPHPANRPPRGPQGNLLFILSHIFYLSARGPRKMGEI